MGALDLFDLRGTVALVTGGSRGLGYAMATGLAEAGAAVVIAARRPEWLAPAVDVMRSQGFVCLGVTCDVTRSDDIESCVARAIAEFGKIDILINDAGISWAAPAEDMPMDKWRAVLDVNATGTFAMSQAVGRHMISRRRGRIINVSSTAGLRASRPEVLSAVGYHASKGAVIAMTMDLASHWAPYGITVNAIAPGYFPTRLSEGVIARGQEAILHGVPLARFGHTDDIKGVAVFLASAASSYMTGQVLVVDGGATIW